MNTTKTCEGSYQYLWIGDPEKARRREGTCHVCGKTVKCRVNSGGYQAPRHSVVIEAPLLDDEFRGCPA